MRGRARWNPNSEIQEEEVALKEAYLVGSAMATVGSTPSRCSWCSGAQGGSCRGASRHRNHPPLPEGRKGGAATREEGDESVRVGRRMCMGWNKKVADHLKVITKKNIEALIWRLLLERLFTPAKHKHAPPLYYCE
jgi:hypothetical protein